MTAITEILRISESVGINDQRFVGQVVSRNQRINTSEVLTVVPFQFTMKPMNYLYYSRNRSLLSELRYYDKALPQYLNFGSTGWVNYIQYQGDMTGPQISSCQWQTSSANKTLVLGSLPSISAAAYIVKAGDFCQVGQYTYIATSDVQRGLASTVDIPVHRNLISTIGSPVNAVIGEFGTTQSMGGDSYTGVTFSVVLREYPQYTLIPITNDSFIQWTGNFVAFEDVV
jgi:hypothetical protein